MTNDTIRNILTKIRNAVYIKSPVVTISKTRITEILRKILFQEGFIEEISEQSSSEKFEKKIMFLRLKYQGIKRISVITDLQRISRPGLRIYVGHKEIPEILGKIGLTILSTSQGLITNYQAHNCKLGGEVICSIWLIMYL
jgi:small subunit ribosomal protein S8